MICLWCGHCCINYDVIIINLEAIQKDGSVDLDNEKSYMHKKSGKECPHLEWQNEKAFCKIHKYNWYEQTPCSDFTQIEHDKNCVCRMGEYIIKNQLKEKINANYKN